jgi:8-oxo-dGTP diphosphatase
LNLLHVAVGVITDSRGRILIALRHKNAHQGGLWEFPGGKLEIGESVQQALVRELKEELNISVEAMMPLIQVRHQYPDLNVLLDVWTILSFSGEAKGCEGQKIKWVLPEQLTDFHFPEANIPIVKAVRLNDEYAILNATEENALKAQLNFLLDSGVQLIQARIKSLSADAALSFFQWAMPLCKKKGALLFINSAVKGVENLNADGIHLTSQDLLALKKKPAGYSWVAASCHNQLQLQHAELIGVDFVVLAPVLATKTHPQAKALGWEQFIALTEMTNVPVFALGGLKKTDKVKVKAKKAGAQGIAGIAAFLDKS